MIVVISCLLAWEISPVTKLTPMMLYVCEVMLLVSNVDCFFRQEILAIQLFSFCDFVEFEFLLFLSRFYTTTSWWYSFLRSLDTTNVWSSSTFSRSWRISKSFVNKSHSNFYSFLFILLTCPRGFLKTNISPLFVTETLNRSV